MPEHYKKKAAEYRADIEARTRRCWPNTKVLVRRINRGPVETGDLA